MKIYFRRMNWFIRFLTWNWARGITLAPIGVFIKDKWFYDPDIREHESIHWYQQLEVYSVSVTIALITQIILLFFNTFAWWLILFVIFPFIFYYIWYFIEWLIKLPFCGKYAYLSISFELEAHSQTPHKRFGWIKYIFKRYTR